MSSFEHSATETGRSTPIAIGTTIASITSLDAARALELEWLDLLDRSAGATPFQDPAWILAWYEIWGADRMLLLAARDAAGRLVGLVPALRADDRIELAGSGVGDYLAPIVDPAAEPGAAAALDRAIAATRLPARFHDVPRDSPWVDMARGHSAWEIEDASVCPVVMLARDPGEWRRRLAAGLQRNLRRYGARIVDDAGARFVTVEGIEEVPAALDALVALHASRWHAQDSPGVFASDDVRRFHQLIAPELVSRGALRLHLLATRGAVIGAQYVLVRGARAYSYIGGFDPAWAKYSPGTLLMAYSIERAIEDGCREFDLLRGREPYKYAWGAVDRTSVTLVRAGGPGAA